MRLAVFLVCVHFAEAASIPTGPVYVNSVGMRLLRIQSGAFKMGTGGTLPDELAPRPFMKQGDFDEHPLHQVKISRSFYLGATEVTNAQYERFDPSHRALRGKLGFSIGDTEAVVFVSWSDARRYTEWLAKKEGLPYRLPTEAEWEYAARAGTTSAFYTGDSLPAAFHKNARITWFPDPAHGDPADIVDLTVGRTRANPWGLYDMHGNVEEWCQDWYGPYEASAQIDPVGREDGDFRVTRGGSHSTEPYYLRSANRLGALPDDKSWLIGFRVVLGRKPSTPPLPRLAPPLWARDVSQMVPATLRQGPDPAMPYFKGPRVYVKIPETAMGPLFSKHNHEPSVVQCPNGDLFAIWFSTFAENGRELGIAASRLRYGSGEWEPAAPFWNPPDRNSTGALLWVDAAGTLYHVNGLAAAATWGALATILRTSSDNGATWSKARLIVPEHGLRHMPTATFIHARDGALIFAADAATGGQGGTAIQISRDHGQTWTDPGGTIAGIHAAVVELKDGHLMALGRGDNIDGMMPKSLSSDMGATWKSSASDFPPISSGQRAVLLRLKEGPIFFASFANSMQVTDASGSQRIVSGLFGALSYDEGETWPVRRLITDDGPARQMSGGAWTQDFTMSPISAEPKGYLTVSQAPDGVINLLSSRLHYAFNLKWMQTPMPSQ